MTSEKLPDRCDLDDASKVQHILHRYEMICQRPGCVLDWHVPVLRGILYISKVSALLAAGQLSCCFWFSMSGCLRQSSKQSRSAFPASRAFLHLACSHISLLPSSFVLYCSHCFCNARLASQNGDVPIEDTTVPLADCLISEESVTHLRSIKQVATVRQLFRDHPVRFLPIVEEDLFRFNLYIDTKVSLQVRALLQLITGVAN